ncbi:MAG: hypothetical protein AAF399_00420 [Bacteroidota bacterium]
MQKVVSLLIVSCWLTFPLLMSQVPKAIPYQAVMRDGTQILKNTNVQLQFTIFRFGQLQYQEIHALSTNDYGLVITQIGEGQATIGQFDTLQWAGGGMELDIELDAGNGWVKLGSQRLLTVPYAMYAEEAQRVEMAMDELSNVNAPTPGTGQYLHWDGNQWRPTDPEPVFWSKPSAVLHYLGGDVSIGTANSDGFKFRVEGGGASINNPQSGTEDGLLVTANAVGANHAAVYATNNGSGAAGYFTNPSQLALVAQGDVGFGTNNPATSFEFRTATASTTDGFRITNAGSGDAILQFALNSGPEYSFGVDNSDGDKFKLGFGGNLSSSVGMTITSSGRVGFGTNSPVTDLAIHETFSGVNSGGAIRYFAEVLSNGAGTYSTRGSNGIDNVRITTTSNANHGKVVVLNSAGLEKAGMEVNNVGQGVIFGDVKNFRVPHPSEPDKEIWYASLEGPEAAAYLRGRAQLVDGRAEVKFPAHFAELIVAESLTILLTPRSLDSQGLAIAAQTEQGFQVGELYQGAGTYAFDWEVKAVRKGYEDFEVVRPRRKLE